VCLRVREFTQKESAAVSRWLKGSRNAVQMRRAQILAFSAQGMALTPSRFLCQLLWEDRLGIVGWLVRREGQSPDRRSSQQRGVRLRRAPVQSAVQPS